MQNYIYFTTVLKWPQHEIFLVLRIVGECVNLPISYVYLPSHLPMSTYLPPFLCLPTYLPTYLPNYVYLPCYLSIYLYTIAADPGASIGLVTILGHKD